MVGVARIELATPAMSRHCPHAHTAVFRGYSVPYYIVFGMLFTPFEVQRFTVNLGALSLSNCAASKPMSVNTPCSNSKVSHPPTRLCLAQIA